MPFSNLVARRRFTSGKDLRQSLGYALSALLVVGTLGYFLASTYRQAMVSAATTSTNEAVVVATQLDSTLRRVRGAVVMISGLVAEFDADWERSGTYASTLDREIAALGKEFPEVAGIFVSDAQGTVLFPESMRAAGVSVADRPHFQAARIRQDTSLAFSEVVAGRATRQPVIIAYRAIRARSGDFRGLIAIPISLARLTDQFSTLDVGEGGMVSIRRADDSRLVVRWPVVAEAVNAAAPNTPPFVSIRAGTPHGVVRYVGATDGVDRIFAFRSVNEGPFYVLVGRSVRAVLQPWWAAATVSTAIVVVGLGLVIVLFARYRAAESVRAAADARYRAIVESQNEAVARWLPDSTLTFANATYQRLFGIDSGQKWLARIDEDLLPAVRSRCERLLRGGVAETIERWESCADGTRRCFAWTDVPILDAEGRGTEVQSVGRDITDYKQAQQQVALSEARLRMALESAHQGWFDMDVEKATFQFSAHYPRMLGYSPEEFESNYAVYLAQVHPDDRAAVVAMSQSLIQGQQETGHAEYRRRTKSGDWIWLSTYGCVAERGADGKPKRIVGVNMDITERRHAELLLKESEQHFRTLANSGSVLIWTADTGNQCDYFNEPWLHFTGRSLEQERGDGWLQGVHPDDRDGCLRSIAKAFAERGRFSVEFRLRRADGEYRWVRDDGNPRYDSGGSYIGYIGFCVDISDQKAAAAELERHRQHLEAMVAERTVELAEARDRAEAANVAKSAFLANMSHEIRTPLNAITGFIHIIKRSNADPRQTERLGKIETASQHLLNLINAVLDLSKIESGKFVLEDADVDVRAIVGGVVAMMQERAAAKQLTLRVEHQGAELRLRGDATRLRQGLLNYLGNAVKFTERGSIVVRTNTLPSTGGQALVRFEVEDTGSGIALELQPRLFKAFEQGDNSLTRTHGGTGLGLIITKRLAQMMGGDAGVETEPGRGSCFWFTACLRVDDGSLATGIQSQGRVVEGELMRLHAGRRVLVVEDDPASGEVVRSMLEDVGLVVEVSDNGVDALEMVERRRYDAILMDVQLPGLNGMSTTRRMRRLDAYRNVPIIGVSANAFAEDQAACIASGMTDFIAKPVTPSVLFAKLLLWLGASARPEINVH